MNEPSGTTRLRGLPWNGPHGGVEYVSPESGVDELADSAEADVLSMARNDAAYALTMVERAEVPPEDLRALVRKLAGAVADVSRVAELRGERLCEPVYGPAVRVLEEALRESFRRPL